MNLNDEVYLNTINNTNIRILDENGNDLGITPSLIEGYRHSEDPRDNNDPFNSLILYFDSYQKGQKIEFSGISDIVGNIMPQPVVENMDINTRLYSYLRDENYNVLTNTEMKLVPIEEMPNLTNSNLDWPESWHITTDSEGKIRNDLFPGTYKVIWIRDLEQGENAPKKSVDFEITIPVLSKDVQYTEDFMLPKNNLEGYLVRDSDYRLEESLVFIDNSLLQIYQDTKNTIESEAFNSLDSNVQDEYMMKRSILEDYYMKIVETDEYGYFKAQLSMGTYTLLGKITGNSLIEPTSNYQMEINSLNEIFYLNNIEFEQPTVFVTLLDYQNNPVSNAYVQIFGGNFEQWAYTNEHGYFGLNIQDEGTYYIKHVQTNWSNIKDGQLYIFDEADANIKNFIYSLTTQEDYVINLPQPNVDISFTVNGEAVANDNHGYIQFSNMGGISTRTGKVNAYLPAGDYTIESFDFNEISDSSYNKVFSVVDSVTEAIDLSTYYNAYVELRADDNSPLSGYRLVLGNEDIWFSGLTNEAGRYYLAIDESLLDSNGLNIKIEGFDFNNRWTSLEEKYLFIDDSNTDLNKAFTLLTLTAPNFRGHVEDDLGNVVFKYGWIDIKNKDTNDWFGYPIDENGNFSFSIEQEGNYIVKRAGAEEDWFDIEFDFKVVYENGKYIVKTIDDQVATMPIALTKVEPNFKGYLYKKDTTPYKEDGSWVYLNLKEANVPEETYNNYPWLFETWVEVDSTGYFEERLDPTKEYEAIAVSTEDYYYRFAKPVIITLGEAENIITPPAYSLNGEVMDYYDVLAIDGDLKLVDQVLGNELWVRIDRDGTFGKNLTNGQSYLIEHVNYRVDGEEYWTYLKLDKEITVGTNSDSLLIQPNIKGKIDLGVIQISDDSHMGVSIRPIYHLSDFSSEEEYNNYLKNPWEYEIWLELNKEIENGQEYASFYSYLKDGSYLIRGIYANNTYIEINEDFIIGSNPSTNVVSNGEKYILDINYSPNLVGSIKENGNAIVDAWVSIVKLDDNWKIVYNQEDIWFGSNTDSNGYFRLNLKEGKYKLEGYNTRGYWVGTEWIEGKYVPVGLKFQFDSNGDLLSESGNPLSEIDIAPNLLGEVYKLDNSSYQPLNDAWFNISKRTIDGSVDWEEKFWGKTEVMSNQFSMMLPEGQYIVTEAGSEDNWFKVDIPFDIDANGNIINIDPMYLSNGNLVIKPEMPNFTGTAFVDSNKSDVLSWGWIYIKPANDQDNDWDNVVIINTDRNGNFKEKIEDGEWEIVEFGNQNNWQKVNIPFSVNGNEINSVLNGFANPNATINIFPLAPNLMGIVKDKDGNLLEDKAWIAIKPVEAGEYDWDHVIWIENQINDLGEWGFEAAIDPGQYKIVEVAGYNIWYKTNIEFEISDLNTLINIEVTPPVPNLTGTVYKDELGSIQLNNGYISIIRIDQAGNQLNLDGSPIIEDDSYKDNYLGIYWQHTLWTETNDQGEFELLVEDGDYKVVAVYGTDTWYLPNTKFTVADSNLVNISISKPAANVTITIKNVPNDIDSTEAWLGAFREVNGNKMFVDLKFKEKQVIDLVNHYIFEGYLEDGMYNINHFGTQLGSLELGEAFTVNSNAEVLIDLGADEQTAVVDGTLTLNISEELIQEEVSLGIVNASGTDKKVIETDAAGNFTVRLPKGTTWKVVEIGTSKGYKALNTQLEFSVPTDVDNPTWDLNITE